MHLAALSWIIFQQFKSVWHKTCYSFYHKSIFSPKVAQPSYPKPLSHLFCEKYLTYNYLDLLTMCDQTKITLSVEMAAAVEVETRNQSKSSLWFTYRAGRITASKMKSACHTDPSNPSQSLIKTIAYPKAYKFSSESTLWGCLREKQARDHYTKVPPRFFCRRFWFMS